MTTVTHALRMHRTKRVAIVATLLGALFALVVLLHMLPGMSARASDAASAASSAGLDPMTAQVLRMFIGAVAIVIMAVTALLVDRARRRAV